MSLLKKIFDSLELGRDGFEAWIEATDGDGVQPDLTEVAGDIMVLCKDFKIDLPEWVTKEMLKDALTLALKQLAANKPA